MLVKVMLVDINPKMIAAWRQTFEENPEVEIVQGSMLQQPVSAWVSPTNARGSMDGGLDAVIKGHLGQQIETRLQQEIASRYGGLLPVGHAICTPTGRPQPKYLISTPTMVGSSEDVSGTLNVVLACAGAFQTVNMQNIREPGSIRSVALPGLGANTGHVPVEVCADLMWTGYNLFREKTFASFEELRTALEAQLGDLTPMVGTGKAMGAVSKASSTQAGTTEPKAPPKKEEDEDFDDFD
ncbi:MAG TPA: macro domain-containing protein [Planctomycetota bacterium]|jgi:O-acetyl-ADP-ribose deacetylase (regulator of RNase III)